MDVTIDRRKLIELIGGEEYVESRIRELSEPIATKTGVTVDELLGSVCCSEGPGFETTYMQVYKAAFLDGVEKSIREELKKNEVFEGKRGLADTMRMGVELISDDFMADGRPEEIPAVREKL